MPRYKIVNAPTYIANHMREPGEVVSYDGWPGSTLEPVDGDTVARRVKDFYVDARKKNKKLAPAPVLDGFADPPPPVPKGRVAARSVPSTAVKDH